MILSILSFINKHAEFADTLYPIICTARPKDMRPLDALCSFELSSKIFKICGFFEICTFLGNFTQILGGFPA